VRVRDCRREAAAMLGLAKVARIMSAGEAGSPFVLGFFHPAVFLARNPCRTTSSGRTAGRTRGTNSCDGGAGRTRSSPGSWHVRMSSTSHPVAHSVKRAIIFERERACDEEVPCFWPRRARPYMRGALLSATGLSPAAATRPSCAAVLLEIQPHRGATAQIHCDERRPRATLSRG